MLASKNGGPIIGAFADDVNKKYFSTGLQSWQEGV